MVSLELLIDATGMERGAAQAARALDSVSTKAASTERAVVRSGASINTAFAGTSGVIGLGTSITTAAAAFDRFNISAAGFAGSRALLEIGRVSNDFSQMGGRIGTVAGAFARLNPYILGVSVALSAVSLGMELFGDRTDDATRKIQKQATALDTLRGKLDEVRIRASYGATDPRSSVGGTIDTLTALKLQPATDKTPLSARDAAALFGVTEQEMRIALARGGLGEAAVEGRQGRFRLPTDQPFGEPTGPLNGRFEYSRVQFSREEVLRGGEVLLGDRRIGETRANDDAEQRLRQERDLSKIREDEEERRQRNAKELERAARELEESARRTGEYFGDGVADLVLGLRSAKEIAASIAQDFVRLGLRQATGALFSAAAGAFGSTGTQQSTPYSNPFIPETSAP